MVEATEDNLKAAASAVPKLDKAGAGMGGSGHLKKDKSHKVWRLSLHQSLYCHQNHCLFQ